MIETQQQRRKWQKELDEHCDVVERKSASGDVFCASRRGESFASYDDAVLRKQTGPNLWMEVLNVAPISAVSWLWTPEMVVGPRVINDSMWFWFEDFEGWAKVGDSARIELGRGSLLLIPRGVPHEIHHSRGHIRLEAVHFHPNIYGGVNYLELMGYPYHVQPKTGDKLFGECSKALSREFAVKSVGWVKAMQTEITRLLFHIARAYAPHFRMTRATHLQQGLVRLLPALEWMDRNIADPNVRIADMAAQVNVCESQFRKLFQGAMGISPVRFIQRQRVERACALLIATDDSIERIAESCGFVDVSFFYRVFHAWTSTAPRQYRRDVAAGRRDRFVC